MQRPQRLRRVSNMTSENSPLLDPDQPAIQPYLSRRRNTSEGSNSIQLQTSREDVSTRGLVTEPGSLQKISSKYEVYVLC